MTAEPTDWFTRFGADKSVVAGYALTGAEAVSRVFLPGQAWPEGTRWADLAVRRGIPLSGATQLADLCVGRGTALRPPYGSVDRATRGALLAVLDQEVGLSTPAGFALWEGYAENQHGGSGEPDPDAGGFCPQGGVLSFPGELGALAGFDEHWPIAAWTTDLRFALAQPIYGDSLYVSSTREIADLILATPELEVFEVAREQPVPPGT